MSLLPQHLQVTLFSISEVCFQLQKAHWNVVGSDFVQMHKFYGEAYEELYAYVDRVAEAIRTLDVFVKYSASDIATANMIVTDDGKFSSIDALITNMVMLSQQVKTTIQNTETELAYDIQDMLSSLLETINKYQWMLKSIKGN